MTKQAPHKLILAMSALLVLTGTAHADWQGQISPRDIDRLAHLNDTRDDALSQARQRGGSGDFRAIEQSLRPASHAVPEQAAPPTQAAIKQPRNEKILLNGKHRSRSNEF